MLNQPFLTFMNALRMCVRRDVSHCSRRKLLICGGRGRSFVFYIRLLKLRALKISMPWRCWRKSQISYHLHSVKLIPFKKFQALNEKTSAAFRSVVSVEALPMPCPGFNWTKFQATNRVSTESKTNKPKTNLLYEKLELKYINY